MSTMLQTEKAWYQIGCVIQGGYSDDSAES